MSLKFIRNDTNKTKINYKFLIVSILQVTIQSPCGSPSKKRNSHYDYSSFCISFIIPSRFHSSSFSFYSSGNYRLVKSPAAISYVICRVLIPLSFCTTVRPSNHPSPSCLRPHHILSTLLISNNVLPSSVFSLNIYRPLLRH